MWGNGGGNYIYHGERYKSKKQPAALGLVCQTAGSRLYRVIGEVLYLQTLSYHLSDDICLLFAMLTSTFLIALSLPLATAAAETVLGVYIFSRHGDRTSKSTPPANLTDLGYSQIFTSGTYFRNRYITSNATTRIAGVNSDIVKQAQITASAPLDTVLMNSAQGFLQGLYPPVGSELGSDRLRDGRVVQAPLDGYQLIPIQTVTSGTGSEDSAWLQGSSNCAQALVSSNEYFSTSDYNDLLTSTSDFYRSFTSLVNATFGPDDISYKNAYTSKSRRRLLYYSTLTT